MQRSKKIILGLFIFFLGTTSVQHQNSFAAMAYESSGGVDAQVFNSHVQNLYDGIDFAGNSPDFALFQKAYIGFLNLKSAGELSGKSLLTIIDFQLSSTKKRMWVIDIAKQEVVYNTVVSHGRNSGNEFAENFSNVNESNMSSYGFYVTGSTYTGKHGLSLYLDGMDQGYNHNARNRAIVMHSAEYANPDIIKTTGRLGRSLGCPAIPVANHKEIITTLADKTCLFIYYPDADYEKKSKFLSLDNALKQFSLENVIPSNGRATASL
jgi:hypothetical protein